MQEVVNSPVQNSQISNSGWRAFIDTRTYDGEESFPEDSRESLLGANSDGDQSNSLAETPKATQASFLREHLPATLCFTLHALLAILHIAALVIVYNHWEHHITFAVEHQTVVSFWAAVATQAFGTIYTAVLVFLTQKLAMPFNLGSKKTLTAIHDNISAWAGLGSALATLFNQLSIAASVFETLNVAGYLMCISILHITIPSILSVEVFNSTISVPGSTFGIPEFRNSTVINSTRAFMNSYPTSFLPWRGILDNSQMSGLFESSLYEGLQTVTLSKGEASISAVGFNVTCGFLPAAIEHVYLDPPEKSDSRMKILFSNSGVRIVETNSRAVLLL
ncbi:hypothetical protein DFH06DRAFT_1291586 [Mycena polygramma]|nr:hypothetical protein DFH06DRAFT_1291586 [Mycena polygramma]